MGAVKQGLLSRLQSYFSASFGGRYVEYVIKEMVEEQPNLATNLFGVTRSDSLRVEYRFRVAGQTPEANSGDKDFYPFTFAAVYSNEFRGEHVYILKYASARILHDKERAVTALKKRINEAIVDAIRRAPPKRQIAKLKAFRAALR